MNLLVPIIRDRRPVRRLTFHVIYRLIRVHLRVRDSHPFFDGILVIDIVIPVPSYWFRGERRFGSHEFRNVQHTDFTVHLKLRFPERLEKKRK